MPHSLSRRAAQGLAVVLVAITAALGVTATAQGWRRPSGFPLYSSPSGGDYRVCRDGIRFEAATYPDSGDPADRPTDPTTTVGFTVYSPLPPIDPNTGGLDRALGTIVAEGDVTLALQAVPYDADGTLWWYYGTHIQRWSGGQLLQPAPDAIFFDRQVGIETDDIEDCLLFPAKPYCRGGVDIQIPEDQAQPGDVPGACPAPPPPDVTICRDGKTLVVPEDQVRPGDAKGKCPPPPPRCAGKRPTIVGTARADKLRGTARADVIVGLGGNDKLRGLGGNDRICGGTGNDTASGGRGDDRVYGEDGNDRLGGDSGRDTIKGGAGRDRLKGGRGRDTLSGGSGNDQLKQ